MTVVSRRALLGGIGLGGLAAVSGGWAPFGAARAQAAGTVNLYTARHYDTDEAIYTNFTRATGIRVNRIEADADKLMERMRAEGANSPADIFIAVDAGRIWRAQEAGLLQPLRSTVLEAAIPANLREPAGHWFGLSKRVRVIAYDKARVAPADIATYASLADPKWKGKLLMRSSTNIYNQSMVGAMIAHNGEAATEAWVKGMVANFARPPRGGDTDQLRGIAAGEGEIAVVNHYYYANLAASTKPEDQALVAKVSLAFPEQGANMRGVLANITGTGIARHSPNRANAVRFLEYLATAEAQSIFAEGNNEYPIVQTARLSPVLSRFGEFREDTIDAAVFARNNEAALKLTDRAGWR
jgi:iron(III) transport system substrate-binding protein